MSKDGETRELTRAEQESFPDDSSVNVALYSKGEWYYADEGPEFPDGELVAMPIVDEDGYYIPVRN